MSSVFAIGSDEPTLAPTAWLAPGSMVIGSVTLAAKSSVWYSAVLRGDGDAISVGAETNVQDGVVVHADPGVPVHLGARVSVGHRAVLHGCVIDDECLVGMGAVVTNGVVLGAGSLVAAGAVVAEGTVVPDRSLLAGVPARVRRQLSDDEVHAISVNARTYVELADMHRRTRRLL